MRAKRCGKECIYDSGTDVGGLKARADGVVCRAGRVTGVVDIDRPLRLYHLPAVPCYWEACYLLNRFLSCLSTSPYPVYFLTLERRRNRHQYVSQDFFPASPPTPRSAPRRFDHLNRDSRVRGNDSGPFQLATNHKPMAPSTMAQSLRP